MKEFIARHAALMTSVLSGFDRLVFRGSLRSLRHRGIRNFLDRAGIRLLDFGNFARDTTERVKETSLAEAERAQRPVVYLESTQRVGMLLQGRLRRLPLRGARCRCTIHHIRERF